MGKDLLFLAVFASVVFGNIFAGSATLKILEIKGDFAKNKRCVRCHLDIYEEFKSSPHYQSTIFRDEVHKKIFKMHTKSTKSKEYVCAKCHTPTVKDTKIANIQKNRKLYDEAIGCAYCHRIQSIEKHPKANKNIISKKKAKYFGTRSPETRSDFHEIVNTNPIFKKGDICLGCHSHKKNEKKFEVCRTDSKNSEKENCVTCHMPQVPGSLSDRVETLTHSYHGFAGVHVGWELLSKYVEIKFSQEKSGFKITVINKAPHKLFLHPMREAMLVVSVYDKTLSKLKEFKKVFTTIIGKGNKPTPPWLAEKIVKDNMIKPFEKRELHFNYQPPKDSTVEVRLGFFLIKPKMAKKMGFDKEEYRKFYILKEERFDI
jgi:hypothetical protein